MATTAMPVKKMATVFNVIFKMDHKWNFIGLIGRIGGSRQNGIYQLVDIRFGKIKVRHERYRLFDESSQVLRLDHQCRPVKVSRQLIATAPGYVAAAAGKLVDEKTAGFNCGILRKIKKRITTLNKAIVGNINAFGAGIAAMTADADVQGLMVNPMAF